MGLRVFTAVRFAERLNLGIRPSNGSSYEKYYKRIPGLPDYNSGPAICLIGMKADAGSEHGIAHQADQEVAQLGSGPQAQIQGTAPIQSITEVSVKWANRATGGECAAEIKRAIDQKPALQSTILGRTTINPPADGSPQFNALQVGTRYTLH